MRLILTIHAKLRMAERGISEADIQAVLANHQSARPGNDPNTIRYRGVVSGTQLRVVAERPGVAAEPVTIVTVY